MPGAWEDLTPEERTLSERIRRDPIAAHGAVADRVGWYRDPDTIWEWEPPPVDVPILARPDVGDALTQMFREGARQGVDGLVGDWIAQSLPWGFALADLEIPVMVWHGQLDHLVRSAHAHYLSAVLPNSSLVLYPQDGHLLFLQHWDELVTAVTTGALTRDPTAGQQAHGDGAAAE